MATKKTKTTKTAKVITAPAGSPFKRAAVIVLPAGRSIGGVSLVKGINRKGMPNVRWSMVRD